MTRTKRPTDERRAREKSAEGLASREMIEDEKRFARRTAFDEYVWQREFGTSHERALRIVGVTAYQLEKMVERAVKTDDYVPDLLRETMGRG